MGTSRQAFSFGTFAGYNTMDVWVDVPLSRYAGYFIRCATDTNSTCYICSMLWKNSRSASTDIDINFVGMGAV